MIPPTLFFFLKIALVMVAVFDGGRVVTGMGHQRFFMFTSLSRCLSVGIL